MKGKIISYNGCVSIFQPNSKISFGTISPLNLISGPTTTLFYYWAGSVSYSSSPSVQFGTIGRVRIDEKDNQPLNQDQWLLSSTGTPSLVRLSMVQKENIPNHHASELPRNIASNPPDWINTLVEEKLKSLK